VIEAVMIGTSSAQGISFLTQGRVLQWALAPAPLPAETGAETGADLPAEPAAEPVD
jgi:hypothetical protein